ncbi:hypothetical protein J2TS6_48650 [Paenibacillus albilobatus]|uniref:Uncharacterized protein n=1 Tax=Paenibacillus albilobatus TaxID=2716884 RepID=A0A919XJ92_9BACL|nr:hypothetical protein J2TS6_48650 [Paenibacillus albilobatus]
MNFIMNTRIELIRRVNLNGEKEETFAFGAKKCLNLLMGVQLALMNASDFIVTSTCANITSGKTPFPKHKQKGLLARVVLILPAKNTGC